MDTSVYVQVEMSLLSTTENVIDKQLLAYPNPINDRLTVKWGKSNIELIQIINVSGKSETFLNDKNNREFSLNLSSYHAGVYLMKIVRSGGETRYLRFIVQ